ncbi:16S rRNA (cytosine(967)-C(5))-methyltransferase RsmB [Haloimpatiens sp. FM7315]|uniref:16S rRNA (cytosine(967)-C(5))-methyltransferase RsmB n=1 Tax=Haloimpatiens sp. FM7315 TaxID=3298609 RepID=UPI0035A37BC5
MNSREIVVKILNEVLINKAYSNIALDSNLKKYDLNSKDIGLITEVVYGTVRYKYTIDFILNKFIKKGTKSVDPTVLNILRSAIYQIRYLQRIPDFAVVNEAVNLSKKYVSPKVSKFVNGVLRNYLRNKDFEDSSASLEDKLAFRYSFPKWMVKMFLKQYGKETSEKIFNGLNEIPDVTVRVNNIKITYDEVISDLENLGYTFKEGVICPEALRILKGKSIEKNPLFKDGLVTVQDESAMLVATIMDLKKHMKVLDLCSAPGGKTTHIAEIMENTGEVLAFDIHEHKLKLIQDNASRLGLINIKCDLLDATKYKEELNEIADRVLIDVPCSGLGIIRKKPEIKWNKNINELKELIQIQRNIMLTASRYVKPGGMLIYSTCTLNKEENEKNIDWFIKNNSNFKMEKIYFGKVDNIIYNDNETLTVIPNEGMDGFFMAKIKKQW